MKPRKLHKRPSLKRLARELAIRVPNYRSADERQDERLSRVLDAICQKSQSTEATNGRP